jgi:hypothetical protein
VKGPFIHPSYSKTANRNHVHQPTSRIVRNAPNDPQTAMANQTPSSIAQSFAADLDSMFGLSTGEVPVRSEGGASTLETTGSRPEDIEQALNQKYATQKPLVQEVHTLSLILKKLTNLLPQTENKPSPPKPPNSKSSKPASKPPKNASPNPATLRPQVAVQTCLKRQLVLQLEELPASLLNGSSSSNNNPHPPPPHRRPTTLSHSNQATLPIAPRRRGRTHKL